MNKKVTMSALKADVGSIGGHTRPSRRMLDEVRDRIARAVGSGEFIDGMVTHTGDDIAIILSHEHGVDNPRVHGFAWDCFMAAGDIAARHGLYGAKQDLLVDAPSGNIKGAGPGCAEIEFELNLTKESYRPAEAGVIIAADKCGPGAFNFPFGNVLTNPMHNGGLLISPKVSRGFRIVIMDMDAREDRTITLNYPEDVLHISVLLREIDRFAIAAVYSRYVEGEQMLSASTSRLHNVAGTYTGKDDPIAIIRTQGIFPATEEVVHPFAVPFFVTGDCRGSHIMPLVPMAVNSGVNGPYCLPIVTCFTYSMDAAGRFTDEVVDEFGAREWDPIRDDIIRAAVQWRQQGFYGPAMASKTELAYTGIAEALANLDGRFVTRSAAEPATVEA